jgi:hypothetical protein
VAVRAQLHQRHTQPTALGQIAGRREIDGAAALELAKSRAGLELVAPRALAGRIGTMDETRELLDGLVS